MSPFVAGTLQILLPCTVSEDASEAAAGAALVSCFCKLIGRRLGVVKIWCESSPVYCYHSGGLPN